MSSLCDSEETTGKITPLKQLQSQLSHTSPQQVASTYSVSFALSHKTIIFHDIY